MEEKEEEEEEEEETEEELEEEDEEVKKGDSRIRKMPKENKKIQGGKKDAKEERDARCEQGCNRFNATQTTAAAQRKEKSASNSEQHSQC
jgi:hypothetical protein